MGLGNIWIGNANTMQLTSFRDALTGSLENDVTAFSSLCYPPPESGMWLVEGASNATPIVITSTDHGLETGDIITIVNVGDNRGAHGTFTITLIDADNFSLNGSTPTADWSTGGQFYECVEDMSAMPYSAIGNGNYQLTFQGNVGLVPNGAYVFVTYCTGPYRDIFNEVDGVTAKVRGS